MTVTSNALKRATFKTTKNKGEKPKLFVNKGRPNVGMVKKNQPKKDTKTPDKPKVRKMDPAEKYAAQDPDYRRAIAAYRQNLSNLKTQNLANQNDVNTDYATTRARLLKQFSNDNSTQNSDFASRGMFGSGLYAKAHNDQVAQQNQQSNGSTGDLEVSRNRNLRQLNTDVANATTLEKQQEQTAKAAAIQRATAHLGITGTTVADSTKKPKQQILKPKVQKPKLKVR